MLMGRTGHRASVSGGQLYVNDARRNVMRVDRTGATVAELGAPSWATDRTDLMLATTRDGTLYAWESGRMESDAGFHIARYSGTAWQDVGQPEGWEGRPRPIMEVQAHDGGRLLVLAGYGSSAEVAFYNGGWTVLSNVSPATFEGWTVVGSSVWQGNVRPGASQLGVDLDVYGAGGASQRHRLSWAGDDYSTTSSFSGWVTLRNGTGVLVGRRSGAGGGDVSVEFRVHTVTPTSVSAPTLVVRIPDYCPGGLCQGRRNANPRVSQLWDGTLVYNADGAFLVSAP